METVTTALDVVPATKFQILSGILKTSRSADGKMRLHGVASSTTRDLHGDTMVSSALEDMERSANNNLTIFLNHSYDVPEDVAGSVESARMKTRGVDGEGNPNYDLDMDILVNSANPRAVKAFEAIEGGTKLGLSIGALIPEGGATKDAKTKAWIIEHVDLLETSLVGIPANPRSWVEYAAKSLRGMEKDATTVPLGSPTLTLDGSNYKIEGTVDGLTLQNGTTTTATVTTNNTTFFDATAFGEKNKAILVGEDGPEAIALAMCPTCGKSKSEADDCADPYHTKDVEPDVSDAQVTIIQIDTGDGSSSSDSSSGDASAPQDGPPTNPDTGDEDYAATGDDAAAITAGASVDANGAFLRTVEMLQATTSELLAAREQISGMTGQLNDVTGERDTAVAERNHVLIETQRVLDKLLNTPLVRRAVVVEARQELREKFSGVYSEDFLKLLENRNDRAG